MKDAFVLDACALIALTNQEKGSDIVASVFNTNTYKYSRQDKRNVV